MKIAVLSDIHGNIYALREVLKQMKKRQVEVVFLLGDQLGYYNHAREVFFEIRKWDSYIISGNHERAFLEYIAGDSKIKEALTNKYGNCFKVYEDEFDEELIDEIARLPSERLIELDGFRFLICHGSPRDKDEYVYPDTKQETLDQFESAEYDVVFMGHTHYPMLHRTKSTLLINVGSVGQARNVGGLANWGIFNTDNGVFTPQSTPYDTKPLEESLIGNSKEYLYKILKRNNQMLE